MDYLCEFCGVARATINRKSESTRLCLQCNECFHSANPALISNRYLWNKPDPSSGMLWPSTDLDPPSSLCGHYCNGEFVNSDQNDNYLDHLVPLDQSINYPKFEPSSSNSYTTTNPSRQVPYDPDNCSINQLSKDYDFKDVGIDQYCGINQYESLNIDDVLSSFGSDPAAYNQFDHHDGGLNIDCLKRESSFSATESNGCLIDNATEVSISSGQHDCVGFQSSVSMDYNMVQDAIMNGGANCMLNDPGNCNRNTNILGFSIGQVNPNMLISISNMTGESRVLDYDHKDCGISPLFLSGESLWDQSSLGASNSTSQARDKAKMRYKEKKKTRIFGKQIRYASRKARADTRKRVKGRFVKSAGLVPS